MFEFTADSKTRTDPHQARLAPVIHSCMSRFWPGDRNWPTSTSCSYPGDRNWSTSMYRSWPRCTNKSCCLAISKYNYTSSAITLWHELTYNIYDSDFSRMNTYTQRWRQIKSLFQSSKHTVKQVRRYWMPKRTFKVKYNPSTSNHMVTGEPIRIHPLVSKLHFAKLSRFYMTQKPRSRLLGICEVTWIFQCLNMSSSRRQPAVLQSNSFALLPLAHKMPQLYQSRFPVSHKE